MKDYNPTLHSQRMFYGFFIGKENCMTLHHRTIEQNVYMTPLLPFNSMEMRE